MSLGLPLCPLTDLPRLLCGCGTEACDHFTMTPEERAYVRGEVPLPPEHHVIPMQAKVFDLPTEGWVVAIPKVLLCDHGHSEDVFLCSACVDTFERTLGDIPALVTQLDLAITKQTSFLQTGAPVEADPEESTLPYNTAASKALMALWRAFSGNPVHESMRMLLGMQNVTRRPDVPQLAGRITAAVSVAHRVIDRPATPMSYGPCPTCGEDIQQERTTDPKARIECEACGYHASLEDHQHACLEAGADRWLTLTELVSTLTQGGEPITRQRIENMIYRQGLPREQRMVPKWRDERLIHEAVYVYRLGDVRDMTLRNDARREA